MHCSAHLQALLLLLLLLWCFCTSSQSNWKQAVKAILRI
jgi:hypothetical protein